MNKKVVIRVAIIVVSVVLLAAAGRLLAIGLLSIDKGEPAARITSQPLPKPPESVDGSESLSEAKALLASEGKGSAVKKLEEVISTQQGSAQAYEALMMLARIYKEDNNLLKAKEYYKSITNDYSQYADYSKVQKGLSEINIEVLFSKIPTPDSEIYTVVPGDSLTKIAKSYSTTIELIKKANGLTTDTIMPGQKLKVQKDPFSVIVDKSQSTLTLILNDEVVKTYTVSTGKNNSTPAGTFKIKDKLVNPTWYSTNAVIPPESPENILGTRWMGLTTPRPGFGIHGTTEPESIGYQCTDGCVRMVNKEVEELYAIIPVGTEVTVID